ncbi:MAG: Na/Pi cotransporter family protein [Bacteroidetes bacterium]|nr:Na/Pi cotransporter family protein [Bacteroidota bacterium]
MQFGVVEFLMLAGSVGLFVFGMKVMSEGLQKVAGGRMRRVLDTMTGDRLRGLLTGFTTTAIVQYSSVTSVMVVSFVNAGVLSLRKAIPVLMGANIGTTVKLLLFTAIGFSAVKLSAIALPIMGLALPLLFMRTPRWRAVSELMVGAALLFLALEFLKDNIPQPSAQALRFLREVSDLGILSDLLFVLFGALLAIVIQSSSVALVLTVVLCETGTIGYEMAAALVLGENIGTTLTANIAALVGNAWAKRAARAHFVIKLFGAIWALVLFKPYLAGLALLTERIHHLDPFTQTAALKWALTYLHISFNILNAIILLQLVPWIEKVVTRMVPVRSAPDEEYRLEYIEDPVMALTPELSLLEAKKEIVKFGRLCHRMLGMVRDLLMETDATERALLLERIAKYEDITDRIEVEVSRFLTKTSTEARDEAVSERIRGMLGIIGDLERVGDILFQMSKSLERKNDERLWFSPEQRQNLLDTMALVEKAFTVMLRNLEAEGDAVSLDEAIDMEQRINQQRDRLRRSHLVSVESGDHNIKSGMVYADLFSSCEKLGDHLINVSEALVGIV